MSALTDIAKAAGRDYITPEDVAESILQVGPQITRIATLEVLGKQTDFGSEDWSLCAFVAWRGTVN